ncbi:aminotransferase class V-fold PLP-dependent enzyme [Cesiribacter andamanensis]|uniref:aminotransferase class V-fold PLP-dependent enzyme n=1 Tax=Cesiribacter andamanensis TaxID=649507 RepID=UPI000349BE49|nr:aminotransferase class V-fold PLP-dependent enzyme [Cesiribacter andamanensis]
MGPSELYFTAEMHLKEALRRQIPSMSHRGTAFQSLYRHAAGHLRELLNLPESYYILFLSSGTEAWERILQSCVEKRSCHLVNGAFSKRFAHTAKELCLETELIEAPDGSCCEPKSMLLSNDSELIALTYNETSTGAMQPASDIADLRKAFQDTLLAVDVVSATPYLTFDVEQVDSLFFSVQKGFGLPAGLGVWIVNERCLSKAVKKQEKEMSLGSYHSLPGLIEKAEGYETPETPNVLGIYLLGKIAEEMNLKGAAQIRKETEQKAAILYQAIEDCAYLAPFVKEKKWRSKTTLVAELQDVAYHKPLMDYLSSQHLEVSSGYGKYKDQHIRIANFPAHSKEQVERLADALLAFKKVEV